MLRLLLPLTFLLFTACKEKETSTRIDKYDVRGKVVSTTPEMIMIYHEPIYGYKNQDGEKVGMKAMTMPFLIEDHNLAAGLKEGDIVSLKTEARWNATPKFYIIELKKLPPNTYLHF